MSSHSRVLKVLGCCLGLPVPALVYEDVENETLNIYGSIGPDYGDGSSLPWNVRLRISKDIANALTYLHNAFSRPIIHRNVKPASVLLDKDFVPKLSCFSFSISIPEGETCVPDIVLGTMGYIDPDYYATGFVVRICGSKHTS
nr:serine/threonine-protein kinase ZRK1-like [Ziziphus jujuba var. spinosa]